MADARATSGDHELRAELRSTARSLLGRRATVEAVLGTLEADSDGGGALWLEIGRLGWPGTELPDAHDGVEAGFAELCVLLEEVGRSAAPLPLLSTTVLGAGALLESGDSLRGRWLGPLARGEVVVTGALTGNLGIPSTLGVVAEPSGHGWRLDGTAGFVLDLDLADAVAVAARDAPSGGTSLFLVQAEAEGAVCERQPTVDRTRRLGRLCLSEVEVHQEQCIGRPGDGSAIRSHLLDRLAVALAADAVGGAERVLELTLDHLMAREQFGRPIGSFQALKHRCANMYLQLEASRSAVEHAAVALGDPGQSQAAASIAKSYATEAFVAIAAEGVQMHGGIGFTWEHPLHLYLKRAQLDRALAGDPMWHRERLVRLLLEDSGSGS